MTGDIQNDKHCEELIKMLIGLLIVRETVNVDANLQQTSNPSRDM